MFQLDLPIAADKRVIVTQVSFDPNESGLCDPLLTLVATHVSNLTVINIFEIIQQRTVAICIAMHTAHISKLHPIVVYISNIYVYVHDN